ncbi:MAG: DUF5131 family protein, partial [Nitrospirota bacterium]
MGQTTGIAWTDHTFNPWWGCEKVSEGCRNCYAATFDKRVGGDHWGKGKGWRTFGDKHWNDPVRWNKAAEKAGVRRKVFCASMADIFQAGAPVGDRVRLFSLIKETPWLDWQLLTKRPELMAGYLPWGWGAGWPNVWLGTSVENQETADERIPFLLQTPAAVRFVSYEPALGPVSFRWLNAWPENAPTTAMSPGGITNELDGLRRLDLVIVGGESG